MKKPVLILFNMLVMAACTTVRFQNPQPPDVPSLTEFPQELQGLFLTDENDTLEVFLSEFNFRNGEEVFLSGDLASEETVLKKFKNMYVINLKDQGVWDAFLIKVRKNRLTVYSEKVDADIQELMEEISKTSSVQEIPDDNDQPGYYLVNPSAADFETLWRKKLFSDKLIFTRVSKN